jgi:hypothetical protein
MSDAPLTARGCRCDRPVLDGESCLRCGRMLVALPESEGLPSRRPQPNWSQAGVIRALQAFAFFRGRPPEQADWNSKMAEDWPALATVVGLFGSVDAAVRAAGLEQEEARYRHAR